MEVLERHPVRTNQVEALFYLMFQDIAVQPESMACDVESHTVANPSYARFALWATYQVICSSHNPSDKQIIYWLKNKFDIQSNITVKCLKALDSIFEAVNIFNYNRKEKCKRYNTDNKDQTLIQDWCAAYEKKHPETTLLTSKLKIQ